MQINVEKLNIEIDKYNNLISEYEEIYLKFYAELKNNFENWKDEQSNYFFSNIDEEELNNRNLYQDLVSIKEVYNYLIEKYLLIGKKINIELDNKDSILSKFDNYINKLENLINVYKNLDVDFDQNLRSTLLKQRRSLENDKSQLIETKDKYKKYFIKIEEIEKQVKQKLSKIIINSIKENSIQLKNLGDNNGKYYISLENINNSIKKLNLYKQEEDINIENIKTNFKNINNYYITANNETFQNIQLDLLMEFKCLRTNHSNNIVVLNKKLESGVLGLEGAKKIINDMTGGSL